MATFNQESRTWHVTSADTASNVDTNDLQVASLVFTNAGGVNASVTIVDPLNVSEIIGQLHATSGDTIVSDAQRRWPNGFRVSSMSASTVLLVTLR